MKYVELRQQLKDFTIFSLSDIKSVDRAFHRRRLNEWQEKGYIQKIIKGYYIFSDLEIGEGVLFEIANRIYAPSYVSLEMALSYYNLIPESVYLTTSVSTRRTNTFKTQLAEFSYRTVKPNLFFGYELAKHNDKIFKIALVEKAVLDYFYLNPQIKTIEDLKSVRFDCDMFFDQVSEERLFTFLEIFASKTLAKRTQVFWEYLQDER